MTGYRGRHRARQAGIIGGALIIIAGLGITAGLTLSGSGPAAAVQLPSSCPSTTSAALASAAAGTTASSMRAATAISPATTTAAPLPGTAQGIDISSHNAEPTWATLKSSGVSFVGIKATEGDYYVNTATTTPVQQPGYATEVADAAAAGLYIIPYAFANPYQGDGTSANPGNGSGTCQADYAWQEVSSVTSPAYSSSLMLPVVLDIEQDPYTSTEANSNSCYGLSAPDMTKWLGDFLTEMQAKSGKTPIVYTNPSFWSSCTGNATSFTTTAGIVGSFSSYPLWLADYGIASPPAVAGWSSPAFWQYTNAATVTGESGTVDADYLTPVQQNSTVGTAVAPVQVRTLNQLGQLASPAQSATYSATGLPPGLAISAAGVISGTPSAAGSHTVSVTVALSGGTSSTVSFIWNVAPGPITIAPQSARFTAVGSPTSVQVSATDTNSGATVKFTESGLPAGLSVNSTTGLISGWPATAGTYSVKVTATDGLGATASASFTWTIKAVADSGITGSLSQHGGSDKCLDDPSSRTTAGTAIDLATCTGKANQAWTSVQDGSIRVLGHCLAASGTHVLLYPCDGSIADQWRAGTYGSLIDIRYGTCLNGPSGAVANGTQPTLVTCQNTASKVNQHWTRPAGPVVSGIGQCLGLSSGIAVLVTCANSTAQHWAPEPAGTFALQANGWCLADHTTAGSLMSLVRCSNTTPTQQWTLAAAGNIAVQLKNPATGLCITVPSGGTTGTKLVLGTCSTALSSTWRVG